MGEMATGRERSSVGIQGRHVALEGSRALNQNFAEKSAMAKSRRVNEIIAYNRAMKAKEAVPWLDAVASGTIHEDPEAEVNPRSALVSMSNRVLRDLLEALRRVDVEQLNFDKGVVFVTWNFPKSAQGAQIRRMSEGMREAIKASGDFMNAQGRIWRELSRTDVYHEHGLLHFHGGVDADAFEKFLARRLQFRARKEKLTTSKHAVKVQYVTTAEHFRRCSEYAGKREKQADRRRARLDGGGRWSFELKALPVAPEQKYRFRFGSQYYAFLAMASFVTSSRPKDFRNRTWHLETHEAKRLIEIALRVAEHEVPWSIPMRDPAVDDGDPLLRLLMIRLHGPRHLRMVAPGVAAFVPGFAKPRPVAATGPLPEYAVVVVTNDNGMPTALKFYYGEQRPDACVEVTLDGLEAWGEQVLRRHGSREGDTEPEAAVVLSPSPYSMFCIIESETLTPTASTDLSAGTGLDLTGSGHGRGPPVRTTVGLTVG